MNTRATIRKRVSIEPDGWAILLACLFVGVIAGALVVGDWVAGLGTEPAMADASSGQQAAGGAGWALAEVAAAVVLLGIITVWRRLPEWAQDVVKDGVLVVASMIAGSWLAPHGSGAFWAVAAIAIGYHTISKAANAYDVYWILNDIEALAFAIVGAGVIGVVLPLPFLVVGLVGLTVYDHVFANREDWMFSLGAGLLRAKLPLVVFAIPRLRVDWEDICDAMAGDGEAGDAILEDNRGFGIGTADLLLPAALAVGVVAAVGTPLGGVVPVLGVTIGVVVAAFRLRWQMLNIGSGAGLPAITSGALGGWALGAVVVMAV